MEAAVRAESEQQLEASMHSILQHQLHMSFDDVMRAVRREAAGRRERTEGDGGTLSDIIDLVVSDYIKQQFQLVSQQLTSLSHFMHLNEFGVICMY